MGAKYEERQCAEYMKLALQGVSVIYSSGDSGVAGNGDLCLSENGTSSDTNDGTSGKFNPSFPGGCPWVTSVGATQLLNGSTVADPESACERVILSGGGFSNVFSMPEYQKSAIAKYYDKSAPPYGADRYNNSQVVRGFPDVSANGANYVTAVDGKFSLSYGTSGEFEETLQICVKGRGGRLTNVSSIYSLRAGFCIHDQYDQRATYQSGQEARRLPQPDAVR